MSGHTPGPWKVVIGEQAICEPLVSVIGADGIAICDNETYYPAALKPENANLIAAAPDLLEALVRARDDLNNAAFLIRKQLGEHHWLYGIDKGKKIADAAIARAKGEE